MTTANEIRLEFPVHTLRGEEILPSGTVLDAKTMASVAAAGGTSRLAPLLEHGSVAADLDGFMGDGPYEVIFADSRSVAEVRALMSGVSLPLSVLESLDHYRRDDFYTYRHVLLVFAISVLLAREMIPDRDTLTLEAMAGPTHDFGKVCVPLEILTKASPLTADERRRLEHHAAAGYVLLTREFGDPHCLAARVARDHHEKRDGSGYPRGIRQQDPVVEIVAVSDIYDALISPRPYRQRSYDNRTALEELTALAIAGRISSEVLRALIAINRHDKPDPRQVVISGDRRGDAPAGNLHGIIDPDDEG